jgi:RHS repeat-associated protein
MDFTPQPILLFWYAPKPVLPNLLAKRIATCVNDTLRLRTSTATTLRQAQGRPGQHQPGHAQQRIAEINGLAYPSIQNPKSQIQNRLSGQRREESIQLYDYRARFYDPLTANFLSPDSLVPQPGNPVDWNRYAYVRGNPVRYSDPSGHACVPCLVVGGVIIALDAVDIGSSLYITSFPEQFSPEDVDYAEVSLGLWQAGMMADGPMLFGDAYAAGVGAIRGGKSLWRWGVRAFTRNALRHGDDIPGANRLIGAVTKQAGELISTYTPKRRSPVVTGVMDSQTGEIFFGTNHDAIPENLHPILAERLGLLNDYLADGGWHLHYVNVDPGTHSEIHALNKALHAREARLGRSVTESELREFLLHNRWLQGTRAGTGVPPRCGNCEVLTEGVTIIE